MPVTHGVPTITINHDHQFLVCDTNATMVPTAGVGFFARDTRFVSGYNLTINGRVPLLLDASPFDHFSARWEFTSPELPLAGTRNGAEHDVILEERALGIRLDRTIFEGIHEDYDLINYAAEPVRLILFIPAAGIPWSVTLFGRDTLVVAMESISGFPEFAFGALDRLSRVQATDDNAEQDKEPGKIPHELRYGELASLGLLPFAPYFGTADATLLFLIVFSYAFQW